MEVGASIASRVMDRRIVLLLAASVAVSCGASDETEPVAEAAAATTTVEVVESTVPETTIAPASTTAVPETTTTTTVPEPVVESGDCSISSTLTRGTVSEEVRCIERHLWAAGYFAGQPDDIFDIETARAVLDYQANTNLIVDGIAGQQTSEMLGLWVTPPPPEPDPETCADIDNGSVIDREFQRSWLCSEGEIIHVFPITTAWNQPDPADYRVLEKDMEASSIETGSYTEMTHFVVFTRGKFQGARVGYHSVPTHPDGEFIQTLESVGTEELHGQSSGCIRARPDDAVLVWDHLEVGDTVRVIS